MVKPNSAGDMLVVYIVHVWLEGEIDSDRHQQDGQ
jgi:hypothetical protein